MAVADDREFNCVNGDWDIPITDEELRKLLLKLQKDKATGSDLFPNKMYVSLTDFLASPLKRIFSKSIQERSFPAD